MRELDLVIDTRPTGPSPVPLDPFADEQPSRVGEALRFAAAVAAGAAILSWRAMLRRPFASVLAAGFVWGSLSVAGNLLSHRAPHPRPLFARADLLPAPAAPVASQTEAQPAQATPVAPVASPRERADIVRDLQQELTRLGHYQGTVDGRFGPRTERAVRAAEKALLMPETGQPSERLLAALLLASQQTPRIAAPQRASVPAPAAPASAVVPSRSTVLIVQTRLAEMGYAPGRLTGDMTPEFRKAIERFRKDNDLAPTAEIDAVFLQRLAAVTGPLS